MKRLILAVLAMTIAAPAAAATGVEKKTFPAKGTKSCRIGQWGGSYQTAKGNPSVRTLPRPYVQRDGSVQMGFAEDLFPGSKVYYLIGDKRYVGDASHLVPIDRKGVQELKKGALIQYTFTRWPHRNEINGADIIDDFAVHYDDCAAFMRESLPARQK